jgi:hypothetical protein
MNTPQPKSIFNRSAYTGVRQDKYPPGRIKVVSDEPLTATTPADNRPNHHGSETRQTQQIAGRVPPPIKSEIVRLAKLKGWTESKTVATLVEQALAHNLAEQFGVMLKTTLQDAITKQLQKENNRHANLALKAFYAAEQARILTIHLLRLVLEESLEELPLIIAESQKQALENMRRYTGEEEK